MQHDNQNSNKNSKKSKKLHQAAALLASLSLSLVYSCSPTQPLNLSNSQPDFHTLANSSGSSQTDPITSAEIYQGPIDITLGTSGNIARPSSQEEDADEKDFKVKGNDSKDKLTNKSQEDSKPGDKEHQDQDHDDQIKPFLDCVTDNHDGSYTAFFSYKNPSHKTVIPIGKDNRMYPGPANQGQPTEFQPQKKSGPVFQVRFTSRYLVWVLAGHSIVAHATSEVCGHHSIGFDPENLNDFIRLFPNEPGNKNIPVPETSNATVSMNNFPSNPVATGQALIKIAEPVSANLAKLTNEYGLSIIDGPTSNGFYLVMPNMTKIRLNRLQANLQRINRTRGNDGYQVYTVSLANLETARTLAFVAELMLRPEITGVGFNPILETQGATPPDSVGTFETNLNLVGASVNLDFPFLAPLNPQNLWYMNEHSTSITKAWNYSLGYNMDQQRPVKVAVIDDGFAGILTHTGPGLDLEGQLLLDEGRIITYKDNQPNNSPNSYTVGLWDAAALSKENTEATEVSNHGMYCASLIVSHANDQHGIAGVAPGARVVPFKVAPQTWQATTRALEMAIDNAHVDVASISLGGSLPDPFTFSWSTFQIKEPWYSYMQSVLQKATASKTLVVASAGNGGWDVAHNVFAGRKKGDNQTDPALFPEVITVGAAVRAGAGQMQRDTFNSDTKDPDTIHHKKKFGSNWGDNVDIWAPGDTFVLGRCCAGMEQAQTHINSAIYEELGTSMSAPMIAGIAALMKARDPNLDRNRFLNYLNTKAYFSKSIPDDNLRSDPTQADNSTCGESGGLDCGGLLKPRDIQITVPDAFQSIQAIPGVSTEPAQSFSGDLTESSGKLFLTGGIRPLQLNWSGDTRAEFIQQFVASTANGKPTKIENLINKYVTIDGWLRGNELYVLQVHTNRQCLIQEISTSPKWSENVTNGGSSQVIPAKIVNSFASKLAIPPLASKEAINPIWSGNPACTSGCNVSLSYGHTLPPGYQVEQADIWLQGDPEAKMSVSANGKVSPLFGNVTASQTFNANPTAAVHFTANANSVRTYFPLGVSNLTFLLSATQQGSNPAAVAAKIRLEACTDSAPPAPPSIGPATLVWDKSIIYVNGSDWANLTIKDLHYPNGTMVPDGELLMISFSELGDPGTKITFADTTPFYGFATPVNGEIHLKVASTRHVAPGEYSNSDWPRPGNPAVTIPRMCTARYENGYQCKDDLTPDSSQPRLYLKDIYSLQANPTNVVVEADGHLVHETVTFFDREGLPVPSGTAIFGSAGNANGNQGFSYDPQTSGNSLDVSYISYPKSCHGQDVPLTVGMSFRGIYPSDPAFNFGSIDFIVAPYNNYPC